MQVSVLLLRYKIMFNDADYGLCYAGDGTRILEVHSSSEVATEIANEFNPLLKAVRYKLIKKRFGIDPWDEIQDAKDFEIVVETHEVK